MATYLFDLGDSNHGPVGAVIQVTAKSKREAFAKAKRVAEGATDEPVILQTSLGIALPTGPHELGWAMDTPAKKTGRVA
jgi:hypothetical protein